MGLSCVHNISLMFPNLPRTPQNSVSWVTLEAIKREHSHNSSCFHELERTKPWFSKWKPPRVPPLPHPPAHTETSWVEDVIQTKAVPQPMTSAPQQPVNITNYSLPTLLSIGQFICWSTSSTTVAVYFWFSPQLYILNSIHFNPASSSRRATVLPRWLIIYWSVSLWSMFLHNQLTTRVSSKAQK